MPIETSCSPEVPFAGAILAAGRGRRISARYGWLPKALVPVEGRPLLAHQLGLLRRMGIRRVAVVVGFMKEKIIDYLETTHGLGLDVAVVEQRELRGPGQALLTLEGVVRGPFVLFLGDIFILPADLSELVAPIARGGSDAVLAVDYETDPGRLQQNFSVEVDDGGWVTRVVEKPAGGAPALKGCGVYALTRTVFEAVRRTAPDSRGEVGITEAIQTLVDSGARVRTARISRWDMNLTRPGDPEICEERIGALARRTA